MKKLFSFLIVLSVLVLSQSCKKDETVDETTLEGEQSPMGNVGTQVSSTSATVSGVSNFTATVVSLSNGISSYSGMALVTNPMIKNILTNIPGMTINGDTVKVTGFQIQQTIEGIKSYVERAPGILVKYASNVGDSYPVGSTGIIRSVVSKSTTDEYPYGFYLIKVMKIEEPITGLKSMGVNKITYWANHKFGLVGVKYDFSDGTSAEFPVYSSTQNGK